MRILILHNFYQYRGGEDTYFISLARLLKVKGHQVITYAKDSGYINNSLRKRINVGLGMYKNKSVEEDLSSLIKTHNPNIVHINNIYPLISASAYQVCKKNGIPIVQTAHNYRFVCPKGTLFRDGKICELCVKKNFAYPSIFYGCYHNSNLASLIFSSSFFYHRSKGAFDCIDKFIFPSEFTRRYYIDNLGLEKDKTNVIPYFVENESKPFNSQRQYFLYAGRLSEEKGIIHLLDIFSNLLSYKLVVLGDGPLRNKVEQYRKYKNIIIKGFISPEKMHSYFREAICTIIPSLWYEVLPMVMLESFVNSTPVIVPNFGTFQYTVTDGKNGFFYEQYNFNDLKAKILYVWNNRNKIEKMREFARKEYEEKYTPEKHYRSLLRVYQDLVR